MLAELPLGDRGTLRTLETMRHCVYEAVASAYVRAWGVSIVAGLGRDQVGHVAAVRAFLASTVDFLDDPIGVEWVTAPSDMLRQIETFGRVHGDCDDVATLGAALGSVIGIPSRFVVLSFGGPGDPYAHVYAELFAGGVWRELDTTRTVGDTQRAAMVSRRLVFPCLPAY